MGRGLDDEARGLRGIGHSDLGGYGDGMQVQKDGDALYVGHFGVSGAGTSILDASDPTDLRLVTQWMAPHGSHTHKVQVADGLLLVNHERFRGGEPWSAGMAVYDLADPFAPRQVGWFASTGLGVHRIVWMGGDHAYVSATPEGFNDRIWVVVDMTDPGSPRATGRWWWPGQHVAAGEEPTWPEGKRFAAHHALVDGDTAYCGYGDAGLVVLDVSDRAKPTRLANLQWSPGGDTHTCLPLPGRDLLVVTDEVVDSSTEEHLVRVVDVSDPADPRIVSVCPPPPGDYATRGLRFGPHNTHENGPGATAARSWCSSPTSTPACGSTTWPTPSTRSRSRTGCPRCLPGRTPCRSTTCGWARTSTSTSLTGCTAACTSYARTTSWPRGWRRPRSDPVGAVLSRGRGRAAPGPASSARASPAGTRS